MTDDERTRFAAWYRANHGLVLRFVERRLDDRHSAADLAAEVFRIAWTKRRIWTDKGDPLGEAWLYRTARNVLGNEYRRRTRAGALAEKAGSRLDAVADPADAGLTESEQVRGVLDALKEKDREILRLAYWDDLSGETIASVLGCSVGAVWTRLHRARAAFESAWAAERRAAEGVGA